VQIGWAKIGMGGDMPFNQAFTLPLNLTLKQTPDGIRMFANPIEELDTLHDGKPQTLTAMTAAAGVPASLDVDGQLCDILVTIRQGEAKQVSLTFGRNTLTYDFATGMLDKMPVRLIDGRLKLRVLVDRPMFEVVVNDGQCYRIAPRQPEALGTISVNPDGGSVTVESLDVCEMKSIWKP